MFRIELTACVPISVQFKPRGAGVPITPISVGADVVTVLTASLTLINVSAGWAVTGTDTADRGTALAGELL